MIVVKELKAYFKIGSTKPYAWVILYVFETIFSLLPVKTLNELLFTALAFIFGILLFVQLGFNTVRLIRQKPKVNLKKIIINIVLLLVISAFANFTRSGHL